MSRSRRNAVTRDSILIKASIFWLLPNCYAWTAPLVCFRFYFYYLSGIRTVTLSQKNGLPWGSPSWSEMSDNVQERQGLGKLFFKQLL